MIDASLSQAKNADTCDKLAFFVGESGKNIVTGSDAIDILILCAISMVVENLRNYLKKKMNKQISQSAFLIGPVAFL